MLRNWIISSLLLIVRPVLGNIPCDFKDTLNITGGFIDVYQNFIFKSDIYPLGTYQEFNYVEDYEKNKTQVDSHIRGCICKLKSCIRLCCYGSDKTIPNCFESREFTILNDDEEEEIISLDDGKYGVVVGRPCKYVFEIFYESPWKLRKNGSLQSYDGNFDFNNFCFGISNESMAIPYACFEEEENNAYDRQQLEILVHTIGMLISIPFLIITFLIYALIPELRNLHGKSLMCYIVALILVSSLLLYAKHYYIDKIKAITLYYSIFLTFFWMNVLCFDIWRVSRSKISNRSLRGEQKTFVKYSIYAFGIPLLITLFAVFVDYQKPFHSDYLPFFGQYGLMSHNKKTKAVFVNIPILIITIVNVILFIDTFRRVWNAIDSSYDKKSDKRKEIFKKRFSTCLRLFIIMGVIWLMESIAFFSTDSFEKTSFKHTIFQITDFVSSSQGLLIFLVCVCDKRTRKLIAKRCNRSKSSNDDGITHEANFEICEESLNEMFED